MSWDQCSTGPLCPVVVGPVFYLKWLLAKITRFFGMPQEVSPWGEMGGREMCGLSYTKEAQAFWKE